MMPLGQYYDPLVDPNPAQSMSNSSTIQSSSVLSPGDVNVVKDYYPYNAIDDDDVKKLDFNDSNINVFITLSGCEDDDYEESIPSSCGNEASPSEQELHMRANKSSENRVMGEIDIGDVDTVAYFNL